MRDGHQTISRAETIHLRHTNQPSLRMMDFVRSLEYMSSFVRGKAVCLRITMRCILCRHHFCSSRSS